MAELPPPTEDVTRRESFTIAYDGDAIRDHTMDVRDLAPALLAMADLVDAVNRRVNPEGTEVRVKLKATEEGSLEVQLALDVSIMQHAVHLFTGDTFTALANILGVLGFAGGAGAGIFTLLKRLRGGRPEVSRVVDDMLVELTLPDGDVIQVTRPVYDIARDEFARDAAARVIAPLRRSGVDEFKLYGSDDIQQDPVETVTFADVESFTIVPEEVTEVYEDEATRPLRIVTPQLNRNYKWRLSDGDNTFWADLRDDRFWRRIERREVLFGAGDLLVARVLRVTRMVDGQPRTEQHVIEVVQHIPHHPHPDLGLQ